MYDQVTAWLRKSYNAVQAEERDRRKIADWKIAERQHFLTMVQQEGKQTLLEVGAGTGTDSKFMQDAGLQVIATDLSPDMVELCRQKGLTAYVMDFLGLAFPERSFDAIYALNSLLHVPTESLPQVLQKLCGLLKPGGLFYLGVYGGEEREGAALEDQHEPKRFFSYHTDEYMQQVVSRFFEIVYFKPIELEDETRHHFQSMILRKL